MNSELKKIGKDLITYGRFVTDDSITDNKGNEIRIRIIFYPKDFGHWYHKMINGEIVEVKPL